jgi:hypothetical protein
MGNSSNKSGGLVPKHKKGLGKGSIVGIVVTVLIIIVIAIVLGVTLSGSNNGAGSSSGLSSSAGLPSSSAGLPSSTSGLPPSSLGICEIGGDSRACNPCTNEKGIGLACVTGAFESGDCSGKGYVITGDKFSDGSYVGVNCWQGQSGDCIGQLSGGTPNYCSEQN